MVDSKTIRVSAASRIIAFFAYLLGPIGWIIAYLFRRRDPFAMFHTRQSFFLVVAALSVTIFWLLAAWLLAWVPFIGPILGMGAFGVVLAVGLACATLWVVGMARALRGVQKRLPGAEGWVRGLGKRLGRRKIVTSPPEWQERASA